MTTLEDAMPQAVTLRDLLLEIRAGYSLFSPVIISVSAEAMFREDTTTGHTITANLDVDWAEEYTREYANEEFIIIGSNSLKHGLDKPVHIGRSRQCDVRVVNDSVSKTHASIVFERSSGGYFITDENSRNGTFVNSEPLAPGVKTPLWSGAYVSFGDAVFVFIDPPTLRKLARLAKPKS
jgi:hypothetical protein